MGTRSPTPATLSSVEEVFEEEVPQTRTPSVCKELSTTPAPADLGDRAASVDNTHPETVEENGSQRLRSNDIPKAAETPTSEPAPKANRRRFPLEAIRIMEGWLRDNKSHPYPTRDDKHLLAQQTGLNCDQVGNWLQKARRRIKDEVAQSTASAAGTEMKKVAAGPDQEEASLSETISISDV